MEDQKDIEDKEIKRLKEEFDERKIKTKSHPKTSYGKRNISNYFSNYYINSKINGRKCNDLNKYIKIISCRNNAYDNFLNNNRNISRNNPGYLYYKEILNMNKTMQNKRGISLDKNIFTKQRRLSAKFQSKRHRSYTNIFNKNAKSIKDYMNINNPYMPFWLTKILSNKKNTKTNQVGHIPFIKRINHKNKLFTKTRNYLYPKKNRTLDFCDKLSIKSYFHDNIKIPKKIKLIPNRNFYPRNFSLNNLLNMNQFYTNYYKQENYKFEDYIPISEEKERKFYQIQNNFFQTRKEIIEEPEYLEEDN